MKENKNKNQHKHFKMTDEISEFFSSHKKIAIFVAVFLTIVLCMVILVINDKRIENKNTNYLVVNEKVSSNEYKIEAKQILEDFLQGEKSQEITLENLLNLKVPAEYKDFHLDAVIYLESKKDAESWSRMTEKYGWLVN
jgi:hypothetical protein